MDFDRRYKILNAKQQEAVDTIEGPLLVIAGPGTGKTELLSMRTANILRQTDTLPSSILCLTFTDSGQVAMRERLSDIIGPDAYKVAIHTFHSFGSEIINQNAEYFYRGANYQPADDVAQYEIMRGIFDSLDYTNPLASMNGDEYTYLRDSLTVISELKRSGLTSDELLRILDANDTVIDKIERDISAIFVNRISKSTAHLLAPIAEKVANIPQPVLAPAITPYANILALSIAHAVDEAVVSDSTKPISAWKKTWCEKSANGDIILKDRKRHDKLRALAGVYYQYLTRLDEAELYDYDDMILGVIHAMETQPELGANLREKFQYIMIDEFQDTNLAQLRLLFNLTKAQDTSNVMAVGDDDQAIYSFQGADIGNIQRFRTEYHDPPIIVLRDNYRSAEAILGAARSVITQGMDRLEHTIDDLSKELVAHAVPPASEVALHEYGSVDAERAGIAASVQRQIEAGIAPESITILARRHHELVALLPYLASYNIAVNYERRENVLDDPLIRLVEQIVGIIDALHRDAHDEADALLPEILAHPAWGFAPHDIYKLSLSSYRNHQLWLEAMQTIPVFRPFADWLIIRTAAIHSEPFERQIDEIIGIPTTQKSTEEQRADALTERHLEPGNFLMNAQEIPGAKPSEGEVSSDANTYISPLYAYFFSPEKRAADPGFYLTTLEALRTIRNQLRDHFTTTQPSLPDFLEYLRLHRELGSSLTAIRERSVMTNSAVNLMTAHKSKGLEYDHIYIIGAIDGSWGERVRSRSRLINYPANLPLAPSGDTYDERLRLFFVAMTRAKATLSISYSTHDANGKDTLAASFLSGTTLTPSLATVSTIEQLTQQVDIDWRGHLTTTIDSSLRELLAPSLERYKLSATHLSNFLDVSGGGPAHFLLSNLLRFPQAKSAHASYGTAIHATLQRAHDYYRVSKTMKPIEDILGEFEQILRDQHLSAVDFDSFYTRGVDALSRFLGVKYSSFSDSERTELNFGEQGVMVGAARLTGALDLVDIDSKAQTILVTDYKTGKPARDWKGRTEYEKIKLHKYRQQLMFYQLLIEGSRDYSKYRFKGGVLQFVEPDPSGDILDLEHTFTLEELADFRTLIEAVWQSIINLELPDTSEYPPTLAGIEAFELMLIDKYNKI